MEEVFQGPLLLEKGRAGWLSSYWTSFNTKPSTVLNYRAFFKMLLDPYSSNSLFSYLGGSGGSGPVLKVFCKKQNKKTP